jgi:hypothetical protein
MIEEQNTNDNPVRKSIDDLLNEDNLPTTSSSGLPAFNEHEPMDYAVAKGNATNDAKKLMNSLLKFYLSQDLIKNNEYVQLKAKVDTMTLANLINQMEIAEHAITTLMRTIDSGEFTPRMFEVLGGLQKTMLDIMKHQTLHMMAAEENMKKIKRDIDIYSDTKAIDITDIKGISVNRGTRNLMKDIQAELGNEEEIEDTDFDSEEQTDLQ